MNLLALSRHAFHALVIRKENVNLALVKEHATQCKQYDPGANESTPCDDNYPVLLRAVWLSPRSRHVNLFLRKVYVKTIQSAALSTNW
jgi:hypothetical protein